MKRQIAAVLLGAAMSSSAMAALIDRGNGLLYDDVLNVTWLQDASTGLRERYDFPAGAWSSDGLSALAAYRYIDAMNAARYKGYSDWRLPKWVDTGTLYCNESFGGTDCGYNVQTYENGTVFSELAYMFSVNLGLRSSFDEAGNPTGEGGLFGGGQEHSEFKDVGLVRYLMSFAPYFGNGMPRGGLHFEETGFFFSDGQQRLVPTGAFGVVWAVRDGDVSNVPEPGAAGLAAVGLMALWLGRRRKNP